MSQINAATLKKQWKVLKQHGGFSGSFREFLQDEAARADSNPEYRALGSTYADAAWLLLQQK